MLKETLGSGAAASQTGSDSLFRGNSWIFLLADCRQYEQGEEPHASSLLKLAGSESANQKLNPALTFALTSLLLVLKPR